MIFKKPVTKENIVLPRAVFALSGMGEADKLDIHACSNAVVALNSTMTASELIAAAHSLRELAECLVEMLADECGRCEFCGGVCKTRTSVPEWILRAADISTSAKLRATVRDGEIIVEESEDEDLLTRIPEDVFAMIEEHGVCIDSLENCLSADEVVYGDE